MASEFHQCQKRGRWLAPLNALRHDPFYAPIRSDPRVQELIATGEAWLKDLREAKARQAGTPTASHPDKNSVAVDASAAKALPIAPARSR